MTDTPRITTEARGPLWLMGLNRPDKRNAFDTRMLRELAEAYTALEEGDARCGVLFAHGEHFTGGLDLAEVAPQIAGGKGLILEGKVDPWGVHGRQREKPVVMAIRGRCLTLGIELALAQDVVVAADDARFAQIEIKRGIFPFGGATWRLPATAGWGNAMRWLLTGDEFDAREAHRIGLVQEVTAPGQELARAIRIAETIAAQAPLGVKETIRSARRALVEDAAARALIPALLGMMGSEDAREGLMSFLERRAAVFKGK
ncbi:MAG TPA: crotonase/enoyl-CoA hydratase family protein [Haliangiales bacterium]|nr:crotonase/enoyl-CoA hydratase family protein [Haliangiales bacterium]